MSPLAFVRGTSPLTRVVRLSVELMASVPVAAAAAAAACKPSVAVSFLSSVSDIRGLVVVAVVALGAQPIIADERPHSLRRVVAVPTRTRPNFQQVDSSQSDVTTFRYPSVI